MNSLVQPKHTKAMDIRFYWLRDRGVNQDQFHFYWRPGTLQRGDYWTNIQDSDGLVGENEKNENVNHKSSTARMC